jgi:hypothetical protein
VNQLAAISTCDLFNFLDIQFEGEEKPVGCPHGRMPVVELSQSKSKDSFPGRLCSQQEGRNIFVHGLAFGTS